MSDIHHASPPNHTAAHMLLAIGVGAAIGFGFVAEDWISAGFVLLVVLTAYVGYWSGMIKIAASILGLLAGIRFAPTFSSAIEGSTAQWSFIPELFRTPLSLLIAGAFVAVGVILMVRLVSYFLFQWKPHWKGADRWAGAALGGVQGVVISAMLLFAMVVLEPILKEHASQSAAADRPGAFDQWSRNVTSFTEKARSSSIGPVMETLDPMRDRLQDQVDQVTETIISKTDGNGGMQQRISQLVQEFREDPDAQQELAERSGLDLETIRAILSSSKIEQAIQDPRFKSALQRQ